MAHHTSNTRVGAPRSGRFAIGDTFTDADGKSFAYGDDKKWHVIPAGAGGISSAELALLDQAGAATLVTLASVPGLTLTTERMGSLYVLRFNLDGVAITLTDSGVSGSGGSVKLADVVSGAAIFTIGTLQNYTAVEIDTDVTADGDAVLVLGVGTAAANAGDGALTGTEQNVGATTASLTCVPVEDDQQNVIGGLIDGTKMSHPGEAGVAILDGLAGTPAIYLNVSGTIATVDGTGVVTVTGYVELFVRAAVVA